MMGLVFTAPWVLAALAILPVLWWLLRLTPPAPNVVNFPPTRILHTLEQKEETAAKSPWWLTLMRLILAALIIVALAGPVAAPTEPVAAGNRPLLLVIDNGWASTGWESRLETARQALDQARRGDRVVVIAPTADPDLVAGPMAADDAREVLDTIRSRPHAPMRNAIAERVAAESIAAVAPFDVVWLSDGIGHDDDQGATFADALLAIDDDGALTIFRPAADRLPLALATPDNGAATLTLPVFRPTDAANSSGHIHAYDAKGRLIDTAEFDFEDDALSTEAVFERPIELRNSFRRLELEGDRTTAGVHLLDNRSERRTVGLVDGSSRDVDQPLLSATHYVANALAPFSDLRQSRDRNVESAVEQMVEQGVSIIVLTDIGTLPDDSVDQLTGWIDGGGMLVRFAGPRLAASDDDRLLPVTLRRGGRTLGGTLSWSEPRKIEPFATTSPFSGIVVDQATTVSRQVLAAPSLELAERTWAQLDDGTPLVTAARQGDGWVVLFHISTDQRWSSLPLAGTFVEMMQRLTELAGAPEGPSADGDADAADDGTGVAGADILGTDSARLLPPYQALDAFGRLGEPPAGAQPVAAEGPDETVGPDHPPGFYGSADALKALNLAGENFELAPLGADGSLSSALAYPETEPFNFAPWLLLAAAIILFLDALAVLWLSGRLANRGAAQAATATLAMFMIVAGDRAAAQSGDAEEFALLAANTTRLAYVRTGDQTLDDVTEAGLRGLSTILTIRTALEPGTPMAVDIEEDELAFFPLIYWNIPADAAVPDEATLARIDAYMKQGGTILFDTRDATISAIGGDAAALSPTTRALRAILANLDVPALEPVPNDHVLTKAFYLLDNFPGRESAGALWVETAPEADGTDRPARAGDGVSSIMITSNDLAGAWAIDQYGRPLLPMGMAAPDQREMAFRSGVNVVMYTLTGNYKADQVHIPALLERLGQ